MKIIGCDLHARQQTIAMLDSDTGELEEKTLEHEGDTVREFYSAAWPDSSEDRSDRFDAMVPGTDGRAAKVIGVLFAKSKPKSSKYLCWMSCNIFAPA